jgi:hypothetical protein
MFEPSSPARAFSKRVLRWFRKEVSACDYKLGNSAEGKLDRLTRQMRHAASELHKLATLGPDRADLYLLRMTALDLDPDEVCQTVPETCQVLRRVCAICENRTACAQDFARNPGGSRWKDYCPNTGTLMVLEALPWTSKAASQAEF